MKEKFRQMERRFVDRAGKRLDDVLSLRDAGKEAQVLLKLQYRQLALLGRHALPPISEVGFRRFSQFEEDGILLYLFSLIPPVNKICVEICAGNGRECNTTNLIINHGWNGFLFDGDDGNVSMGNSFFENQGIQGS